MSTPEGLHIEGTFNPKEEFFHFLAKFGFQKTELRRRDDSQGTDVIKLFRVVLDATTY
jgi:hypothetical protein